MQRSVLQLRHCWFPSVRLQTLADRVPALHIEPLITVSPAVTKVDGVNPNWRLLLDIGVDSISEDSPAPYTIALRAEAWFELNATMPQDQGASFVAAHGSSLLYSQAREYLLLLTSRAPHGPFLLPTLHFSELKVLSVDAQPEATP